jgi:tRNA A37 threonylcarbamoyladenosine dehydratase
MQLSEAYLTRFAGVARIYSQASLPLFAGAHVCVLGLGGVGSWVVEALARTGIGRMTLVDLDDICISNTNRQMHTTASSIGVSKAQEMKRRCLDINPEMQVDIIEDFLVEANFQDILDRKYDYVCDCIDSLKSKCLIIDFCWKRKIPIVTVGGAGGRSHPDQIMHKDLNLSYNDPLLFRVRKKLREDFAFPKYKGKYGIDCIFSPENAIHPSEHPENCELDKTSLKLDCSNGYGALSFFTGTMGFFAASVICNKLIRKKLQREN